MKDNKKSNKKNSTKDDKKDISIQVLKILKEHSDADNRLTLKQIKSFLENEFGHIDPDERTIKNNIDMLNRNLDDAIKSNKDSKGNSYYIVREFDESELMLLIDSVLSSRSIPENQCKELIEKLRKEASPNFDYKERVIKKYDSGLANKELFYSISIIGEAIAKKVKITYKYCDFDINKKLVPKVDRSGNVRVYTLTPLRMVVNNGRYYVFGVPDITDKLSIYRVDKIKGAEILDEAGKKSEDIRGLKDGMDLGKHIAEHIFMNLGPSETVIFEFNKEHVSLIVDWFGKDIDLKMKDSNTCIGTIKVNVDSFVSWLMMCSFAKVKVTSPKSVIEKIKERVEEINEVNKYK